MDKLIRIIAFGLIIIFLQACDDFLDINRDPDFPDEMTIDLVLPAGISSTAYVIGGEWQILGGFWSQHWTQAPGSSQFRTLDSYNVTKTDYGRQYGELYSGALNDLEYVKKNAEENKQWEYYFIASVMQCYTYQLLADLYDDIPFSEALLGNNGNISPVFDKGETVYAGLLNRIDLALEKVQEVLGNDNVIEERDIVFQGDMSKWIEFANTLKLKIFLRQCYVQKEVAKAGIETLYNNRQEISGNLFLAQDAAMTQFSDEPDRRNPAYASDSSSITNSNTLIQFLQENGDPRINQLLAKPNNIDYPEFRGLNQGDYFNNEFAGSDDDLSKPILTALDPIYFFSLAESYFLQAEARIRFFDDYQGAKSLYEKGIVAAFDQVGADGAEEMFAIGGAYSFPAEDTDLEEKIKAIITQKWVSMVNSHGIESFLEQNRTGYPDFYTLAVNNVTNDRFPRRLIWPDSEYSTNPNTPDLKRIYEKVWWDPHNY